MFPLRGNHEGPPSVPVSPSTIYDEIRQSFDDSMEVLQLVRGLFLYLHHAAVIPGYAFIVHGHVPVEEVKLASLMELDEHDPLLIELLWNDPANTPDNHPSFRGHGYYVGMETTNRFLVENNLKWVIRGHESHPQGYEVMGRTLTLHTLTLPVYNNPRAAYLKLSADRQEDITQYVKQL